MDIRLFRNSKNNRKRYRLVVVVVFLALLLGSGFNNKLKTTYYTIDDSRLPRDFSGYRIAVISDFHCKQEGNQEQKLIDEVNNCSPDLVVFAGDMIDGAHSDITPVEQLLSGLKGKYRLYAVDGNHEKDILPNYTRLTRLYKKYNVNLLSSQGEILKKGNSTIGIYGRAFSDGYYSSQFLKGPDKVKAEYNILLYHDALAFPVTSDMGYNLVLSGHIHGGIIRLPLLGGILGNTGHLFPKYDKGVFSLHGATMVVSSGIGDSVVPRYNNRSEVVCVTLKTGK